MFDLLIKNGQVIDGTGNPWQYGDIGIIGTQIGAFGPNLGGMARTIIDARGKVVTPGFIDIHTHSDFTVLANPRGESKIQQGVTTEIGGNCGFSLGPVEASRLDQLKKFAGFMPADLDWDWQSISGFLDKVANQGTSVNFGTLVGQGVLRIAAMGFSNRPANEGELGRMKSDLAKALDEGAIGLSTGLVYAPGSYAPREEMIELAKIVGEKNKLFTAHIRDEGDRVEEALAEVIDIAERADVPLQVSHLKATGKSNWAKLEKLIVMVEAARARGVDVTFDVYPYTALSTLLHALLSGWAQEGGVEAIMKRLRDQSARQAIMRELAHENVKYGGWENIVVASTKDRRNEWAAGKSVAEIAKQQDKSAEEMVLDLLLADQCSIMLVCYSMADANVERALAHPLSILGSDGKSLTLTGKLAAGKPHPRNYGAFPRFVSKYVRDKKIMQLPEAIRKVTSAPAQKLRIKNRGLLREGFCADVVVFDLERIDDTATFTQPQQYPAGIDTVIVNGKVTIDHGEHSGALAGAVLR